MSLAQQAKIKQTIKGKQIFGAVISLALVVFAVEHGKKSPRIEGAFGSYTVATVEVPPSACHEEEPSLVKEEIVYP